MKQSLVDGLRCDRFQRRMPRMALARRGAGKGAAAQGLSWFVLGVVAWCGCGSDEKPATGDGKLAGQVVLSGPVSGASISVDQLDLTSGEVRMHVDDTTTDADGRFSTSTGEANGLFIIRAAGGSFTDLVTGATVQLDPTSELETVTALDLFEERGDVLVSPPGHLIAERTLARVSAGMTTTEAFESASQHVGRHFAQVTDWSKLVPTSLQATATSPTESVRGALLLASLSLLANDIAQAAGASPQEVNVFTLTTQLAADLGSGVFDGNDGNSIVFGMGLQLGQCPPLTGCVVPSGGSCVLGACRTLCDLYAGTPRALLANEMTKVIASPELNHTGLRSADILAVATTMANNVDDDLFGTACTENLDRLPPTLTWSASTPADGTFVHSTVMLKVSAVDDVDAVPIVKFIGYPDTDGDVGNSVAVAIVDTSNMTDGSLAVVAEGTDMAGNVAMTIRTLQVDNTAPVVTIESTGFYVDGATWWTPTNGPTLHGTLIEPNALSIEAIVGATHISGTITGGAWNVQLPANLVLAEGVDVTIAAVDRAGNRGEQTQRLRYDGTPPVLVAHASPVHDELGDVVTFSSNPGLPGLDETPSHAHNGPLHDLATECPTVSMYSYLLGVIPAPHGSEPGGRNLFIYNTEAGDDGVGLDTAGPQFRVGHVDAGGTTQWVLDWTPFGMGTGLGNGSSLYAISVDSNVMPTLATTEGTYNVELRVTDRFGRTTSDMHCFTLRLLAPPLHLGPMTITLPSGITRSFNAGDAVGHAYALKALTLDPTNGMNAATEINPTVAARLLNDTASASLFDMPIINGTSSVVYVTVTVTPPQNSGSNLFKASQNFVVDYTTTTVNGPAGGHDCSGLDPSWCTILTAPPAVYSPSAPSDAVVSANYPVRIFELDSVGDISTEVLCAGCSATDTVFNFALPARGTSLSSPPRRFLIMTTVSKVTQLWPTGTGYTTNAPYVDGTLGGVRFTGKLLPTISGCLAADYNFDTEKCRKQTTHHPYQALKYVRLSMLNGTSVTSYYDSAATSQIQPTPISAAYSSLSTSPTYSWISTATTLP